MADLFTMTAPLAIRLASGETRVIAECFQHPEGMVYFDLYWHLGDPEQTIHTVRGQITGAGPWKVGEHVVHVLSCHGTDFEPAAAFEAWRQYLSDHADAYPPRPLIAAIARRYGALTADED